MNGDGGNKGSKKSRRKRKTRQKARVYSKREMADDATDGDVEFLSMSGSLDSITVHEKHTTVDLMVELTEILDSYVILQFDAITLNKHAVCKKFPGIKLQIATFKDLVADQFTKLRQILKDVTHEIHGGPEKDFLNDLVTGVSESPFEVKNLRKWLDNKTQEIACLETYLDCLADIVFVVDSDDLKKYTNNANHKYVIVLQFGPVNNKFDRGIDRMSKYLTSGNTDCTTSFNWEVEDESNGNNLWFNDLDKTSYLQSSINSILSFGKSNETNNDLNIVVNTSLNQNISFENPGKIFLFTDGKRSQFRIPGIPEIPKCTGRAENELELQWEKPETGFESVTSYMIKYQIENDATVGQFSLRETESDLPKIHLTLLEEETPYKFQVAAKCTIGLGEFSNWSEPISTLARPPLGEQIFPLCKELKEAISGQPKWFQLPLKELYFKEEDLLQKFEVFECIDPGKAHKVILLVGATGSGKTTLINGLVNHMLGVRFDDNYRFQLISENFNKTQAESQTIAITAYTIHWQHGSKIPYTLTIIDTPGFGDTRGIDHDNLITNQIQKFFEIKGPDGIDELDAIGFVAQASEARLTETQKYVFDSILSIFGKDVGGNIFMMLTFADGRAPQILDAIKAHGLPYQNYFKFNNSVFTQIRTSDQKENDSYMKSSNSVTKFDKLFWSLASDSFLEFFNKLTHVTPQSLNLTREVLNERNTLNVAIDGFQFRISSGLNHLELMRQHLLVIEEFVAEKKANKNFKRKVNVPKIRKIEFDQPHLYVTNCLVCNVTCHNPCGIPNDEDKYNCTAMNKMGQDSSCVVCKLNCHWSKHYNKNFYFEEYIEEEVVTIKDLKEKYKLADKNLNLKENLLAGLSEQYNKVQLEVLANVEQVRKSLARLDQIAMRPNPLTTVDYINILIENTKREKKTFWQQRVSQLENARERAVLIKKMVDDGEKYDPFEKIKQTIIEESRRSGIAKVIQGIKNLFGLGYKLLINQKVEQLSE